jgi:hypothetical protein
MKSLKTIAISLPMEMGREIQIVAKEEHRNLCALAQEGRTVAKKKKITPKTFGGPFEG